MKTIKKLTGLTVALVFCTLIVVKLISNKRQMDHDLKAMLEFSAVVPVEVATAQYLAPEETLAETGIFYSNSDVQIMSETEGKIQAMDCEVGDLVVAGQVLATIEKDVPESRFQQAKENLSKADKDFIRAKNLVRGDAVTQQQLEAARLNYQNALTEFTVAQKALNNTIIKAPISGTVSERLVEKGSYLDQNKHLFTISDQSRMIFRIKMAGSDLSGVSPGEQVMLRADALPGRSFPGKIKNTGVVADLSGRFMVEIEAPNPGSLLRSGMTGSATITFRTGKQELIIPRKCIEGRLEQARIFVLDGTTVSLRTITTRLLDDEQVAVLSGLKAGEEVVTTGQLNLKDGSEVKVTNNSKTALK